MKELKGNLRQMYIVLGVYLLCILFSAVMFTISLIHEVRESIFVSSLTGVLSLVGVFYSGYIIIRIENSLKNMEINNNIL